MSLPISAASCNIDISHQSKPMRRATSALDRASSSARAPHDPHGARTTQGSRAPWPSTIAIPSLLASGMRAFQERPRLLPLAELHRAHTEPVPKHRYAPFVRGALVQLQFLHGIAVGPRPGRRRGTDHAAPDAPHACGAQRERCARPRQRFETGLSATSSTQVLDATASTNPSSGSLVSDQSSAAQEVVRLRDEQGHGRCGFPAATDSMASPSRRASSV